MPPVNASSRHCCACCVLMPKACECCQRLLPANAACECPRPTRPRARAGSSSSRHRRNSRISVDLAGRQRPRCLRIQAPPPSAAPHNPSTTLPRSAPSCRWVGPIRRCIYSWIYAQAYASTGWGRRAHAVHMPCTCHAHAMHMPCTCHATGTPRPAGDDGEPSDHGRDGRGRAAVHRVRACRCSAANAPHAPPAPY